MNTPGRTTTISLSLARDLHSALDWAQSHLVSMQEGNPPADDLDGCIDAIKKAQAVTFDLAYPEVAV